MEAITALRAERANVFAREADGLLILQTAQGESWYRLNETGAMMVRLITQDVPTCQIVDQVMARYAVPRGAVVNDLENLSQLIVETIDDPNQHWQELGQVPWQWEMALPFMGELTLTNRCQNRCRKCYMSAVGVADRVAQEKELDLEEVYHLIYRFAHEVQVTEIIISGGEPTLRDDLPEIVAYAKAQNLKVDLITNGIRAGTEAGYAGRLAEAGLDTVQVSLDSPFADSHNLLVGTKAYKATVAGLQALGEAGIYAYVNSTLCRLNVDDLVEMPGFLKSLGFDTWSANGLIPSGSALRNLEEMGLTYSEFAVIVPRLLASAEKAGVDFSWILPVPYCLLPLPALGFEEKGCTAANIIAITNHRGEFVACNNLPDEVLGDMLDDEVSFKRMWNGEPARWWRERRFIPKPCETCPFKTTCCGACPQYWLNFGDFQEIASARNVSLPPDYTQNWRHEFEQRPRTVPGGI